MEANRVHRGGPKLGIHMKEEPVGTLGPLPPVVRQGRREEHQREEHPHRRLKEGPPRGVALAPHQTDPIDRVQREEQHEEGQR